MDADEITPVVERRPFVPPGGHASGDDLALPSQDYRDDRGLILPSSDSSQSYSNSASTDTSPETESRPLPISGERRGSKVARKSGSVAPSDMSASYHEIFDTQMPPESALETLKRETSSEDLLDVEDGLSDLRVSGGEATLLPRDETAESTTQYLTSKLVQDSLRWQQDHQPCEPSPLSSPRKSAARAAAARAEPTVLDPQLLNDIENDARHLAMSVDGLVENLAAILHSASSVTVDCVETYRDGVCKTCDEVDNNIKAMYQLMAKVEELNKAMGPAYRLGGQLKDIKRLLDMYEAVANAKT